LLIVKHPKYGRLLPTYWFADDGARFQKPPPLLWLRASPIPPSSILPSRLCIVYDTAQRTLITPLSEPEEALFARMNATTRNYVRRAEDILEADASWTYCSPTNIQKSHSDLVQEFVRRKGLDAYVAKHGAMRLPITPYLLASSVKHKEEQFVVHVYLVDKDEKLAYLYWSVSRQIAPEEKDVLGKLNRWLHWQDILWFKRNGFLIYDWGGAGEQPEVINITRFKQGFGGDAFVRYHALVCHHAVARLARSIWRLKRKAA